jgi:FkbM family methyltransferase
MRIFGDQGSGFYVDVGAHHPVRFSNTCALYMKGWSGINIDCNPGSMAAFRKMRSRDINLELAISDRFETLTYHLFEEPAINSFAPAFGDAHRIHSLKEMTTRTLASVFDQYINETGSIDFLSVDVEGLDLNVLKSNNWMKYRPRIVLAEDLNARANMLEYSEMIAFMEDRHYYLFAKTVNTFFFREENFIPD